MTSRMTRRRSVNSWHGFPTVHNREDAQTVVGSFTTDTEIIKLKAVIGDLFLERERMREQLEGQDKLVEDKLEAEKMELEMTTEEQEEPMRIIQELKAELKKRSNENEVLKMHSNDLEKTKGKEIDEREKVTKELSDQINYLNQDLYKVNQATDKQIRYKNREIEDLKSESRKESYRIQTTETEISNLEVQNKELDKKRRDLNEKHRKMKGQIRQNDEENKGLNEKIREMKGQIRQKDEEIKDLCEINMKIKEQIHALKNENKIREEQTKDLDKKIGELVIKEKACMAWLKVISEERDRLIQQVAGLETRMRGEVKQHEEQLRKIEEENEKLHISKDRTNKCLLEEVQYKVAELDLTESYFGLIPFCFIILVLCYAFFP